MASKLAVTTGDGLSPRGPYSQAIKVGKTVYLAGQLSVDPKTGQFIDGSVTEKARQVFKNLEAVAIAAGGSLNDIVKVTIFITDFDVYPEVNSVMATFFKEPFPARSTVAVKAIYHDCPVEVEGIMVLA